MHRLPSVEPQASWEANTGVHQTEFHHLFNHSPLLDIKFKRSHYKQHCMYLISFGLFPKNKITPYHKCMIFFWLLEIRPNGFLERSYQLLYISSVYLRVLFT